mmetsp:Transcript_7490/g.17701  ORF Transcript_7490/g.17701 Transcript_7490/m.17701 type:complete len:91 (-) Transcript_7490:206-478(-)
MLPPPYRATVAARMTLLRLDDWRHAAEVSPIQSLTSVAGHGWFFNCCCMHCRPQRRLCFVFGIVDAARSCGAAHKSASACLQFCGPALPL